MSSPEDVPFKANTAIKKIHDTTTFHVQGHTKNLFFGPNLSNNCIKGIERLSKKISIVLNYAMICQINDIHKNFLGYQRFRAPYARPYK